MCLGSQKLSFDASIEVFVFALKFNVINCFLNAFDIKPHVKQTLQYSWQEYGLRFFGFLYVMQ